jgi:hypothetical protein
MTDSSQITDDTPLRLARAAAIAFPDGSMSAGGLRVEADRGRLSSIVLQVRIILLSPTSGG